MVSAESGAVVGMLAVRARVSEHLATAGTRGRSAIGK